MVSCYDEGEKLFTVCRVADELQKGRVDVPGFTDFLKRKSAELGVAINEAMPYLLDAEQTRVRSALTELTEGLHSKRIRTAATEEIIRTVQLPMTLAGLKCLQERRK